ncbi:hypothetical protein [Salinarimonas sp.]|uniref:hypothetical protein n=1 Tax=Salinarimonas sp. TaxID=2766526 RepID=UPI00391BCDE7
MSASVPKRECDLIMKGGVTSGVVYPKAVLRLARDYRFRSIGGTSAGAIAAAITAAAELNRAGGGFELVASLPAKLRTSLASLFQPSPEARPLFRALGALRGGAFWPALRILMFSHAQYLIVALMLFVTLGLFSSAVAGGPFGVLFALIVFAVGAVLLFGLSVLKSARDVLVEGDFGMCPGTTQEDEEGVGLSDWLAEEIEAAAGRGLPEDPDALRVPLTFGDLERAGIKLRVITTNLGQRRPHVLPELAATAAATGEAFYFDPAELRRVVPGWVVDWMTREGVEPDASGLYPFPAAQDLPVVLAVRMSLSFPLLIAAVPLHHEAAGHRSRVLFSDGGITSNFPIQFFDALLPSRPTFGIALEPLREEDGRRVRLPMSDPKGAPLGVVPITGLRAFAATLFAAAADWHDRLQGTLPGYRERIVTIGLKSGEGGLDLTMSPEAVDAIGALGQRAAALLAGGPAESPDDREDFDFDHHRFRRFLVAYMVLEHTLADAAKAWGDKDDAESFCAFVESRIDDEAYLGGASPEIRRAMVDRFAALMALAKGWEEKLAGRPDAAMPGPRPHLRLTPHY